MTGTGAMTITVADLAEQLGGTYEGDGAQTIKGLATLDEAGPDMLSWVADPELLPKAEASDAGVLLLPRGTVLKRNAAVINVDDPELSLCKALELLAPEQACVAAGVHPSAVIAEDAVVAGASIGANVYVGQSANVGEGTQLHPGVYVGAHASVGQRCVLWPNVVVREYCLIGDRVTIHPNSTIGADGFGYLHREGQHVKIPQIGKVVIEDDVEIGANTTIDRARSGVTRIGRGTKIDNLVQVGHNCNVGEHCILVAQTGISGSVSIGRYVVFGGRGGAGDHVRIGDGSQIASSSAVMKSLPAGAKVMGLPAVDLQQCLREKAALRKLPEALKRIRSLEKKIEQLLTRSDRTR